MNSRTPPRIGLNLLPEDAFRAAATPLFEAGLVDALEWDIDERWGGGWEDRRLPLWVNQMLDLYAEDDALYGHGVWFSVLSAMMEPRQDRWLRLLARECKRRRYRHVSEHFGFMSAGRWSRAPMLPMPMTDDGVRVGVDRMRRIKSATGTRVGLENLAMFLGRRDLEEQGEFLDRVLAPVDGFLLLDVHNLFSLAYNAGMDPAKLLDTYPLDRVREIHVSGGSTYRPAVDPSGGDIRLDSHDGPVPLGAFELLPLAVERCPNLEVVFFERRGDTLRTDAEIESYRADFMQVRAIVEKSYGVC